jgi:hypothetical protein
MREHCAAAAFNGDLDDATALAAALQQSLVDTHHAGLPGPAPAPAQPSTQPAGAASAPPTAAPAAMPSSDAQVGRFNDFIHVGSELSPIRGVFDPASNPEVSIDDATTRTGIALKSELFMAKRWARKPAGKTVIGNVAELTPDQAIAVWLYTCESPLYRELNRVLRAADRGVLRAQFFPYLRLLLSGLAKINTASGSPKRMVNRGVREDLVAQHPNDYPVGETLIWWAVTSTTAKISTLQNPAFLGATGDRTIFQIHTSLGTLPRGCLG